MGFQTDLDICECLVPDYIAAMPTDPSTGTGVITDCSGAYATDYFIREEANGRITVSSTGELSGDANPSDDIYVTR